MFVVIPQSRQAGRKKHQSFKLWVRTTPCVFACVRWGAGRRCTQQGRETFTLFWYGWTTLDDRLGQWRGQHLVFPTAGRVGTRPRKVANFVLVVFLLSFRRGEPQGRISTASVSQTVGAVFGPRTSWSHDRTSVLNRERWAKGREERTGVGDFHALFTPRAPYSDSEGRASASFC